MLNKWRRRPVATMTDEGCVHSPRSNAKKIGSGMVSTSPVTSAGASFGDQSAELFRVIKDDVVEPSRGRPASPELRELIENLYKVLSLKSSHKLITKPCPGASSHCVKLREDHYNVIEI